MIRRFALSALVASSTLSSVAFAAPIETRETKREDISWHHHGVESKDGRWLETFAEDQCEVMIQQRTDAANAMTPIVQYRVERIDVENFIVDDTDTRQEAWPSNRRSFDAWGRATCVWEQTTIVNI